MSYSEQLKSPKWQKKRLEILDRDKWTCQACADTESTLTVHHKSYRQENGVFVDVWDYNDNDLITLCDDCHENEESCLNSNKTFLFFAIREFVEDSLTMDKVVNLLRLMSKTLGRRVDYFDINAMCDIFVDSEKLAHDGNDWFDEATYQLSILGHQRRMKGGA